MNNVPTDLQLIVQHVHEWPEGNEHVRLDADGEICFSDDLGMDFYPDGKGYSYLNPHPAFVPDGTREKIIGTPRSREEWEAAR